MPTSSSNQPRRTLLLTGASRGIGHATVKRFSAAGWREITCSRQPFPENCPWDAGPEDHIQVDLADEGNTLAAIAKIKRRLETHELHALVNNAAISPKGDGGKTHGQAQWLSRPGIARPTPVRRPLPRLAGTGGIAQRATRWCSSPHRGGPRGARGRAPDNGFERLCARP